MFKHYYARFIKQNHNKQHFACHSHHYWPDITREAMLEYWDDSACYVDDKWGYFFGEKVPKAQSLIAQTLQLDHPEQICFAANTHEFIYRLLSCLPRGKTKRILTTDSEFHSFERQINRVSESPEFEVVKIATEPFATFKQRFLAQLDVGSFDMVFISQTFFNSGLVMDFLDELYQATPTDTLLVVDGYHAFMALPTSLRKYQDRLFYLAGSYKYAQGGEGCCFLHVPKNCQLRPEYTGWFAEFDHISEKKTENVGYGTTGMRFAGATMDYSALYRLISVLTMFKEDEISVERMHHHIQQNQRHFLQLVDQLNHPLINRNNLILQDLDHHGHFFTFRFDAQTVSSVAEQLKAVGILTDHRGDRLRFGFGLYHNCDYDLSALTSIR